MRRDAPTPIPTRPPLAEGQPRWALAWRRAATGVRALSLSDDGRGLAILDKANVVRRLDPATGRSLWGTPVLAGINRIEVVSSGQVLAWKSRSPQDASLLVLNALTGVAGARYQKVSGSIWSVRARPDGGGFFVGTGDRMVTWFPLGATGGDPVRMGVPGLPESLAVAYSKPVAACALWLRSGVAGLSGTAQWRFEEPEPARWFDVQISADGETLLAISQKGTRRPGKAFDSQIHVWDAPTGKLLWTAPLLGLSPRARLDASGTVIAVSYETMAKYSTGDVLESKLVLFDRTGKTLASPRGGAYLSPRLVALSASGNRVTVLDGDRSLCTLDATGRTVARLPINPAKDIVSVRESLATADGSGLLLYRGDGVLEFYQATAE